MQQGTHQLTIIRVNTLCSHFAIDDIISVENGSIGTFNQVNATRYSVIFAYTCGITDNESVVTVGQAWNDAAGNAPANNYTSPNYAMDTVCP
jgi:hypothetical protein